MFEIISHVMKLSNYMKILLEKSEHNMERSTILQDQSTKSRTVLILSVIEILIKITRNFLSLLFLSISVVCTNHNLYKQKD